jgi:energy-converting hydrogenase Eha subunit G
MGTDLDDRGRRRTLSGWETAWWYGFAGVTYIAASIVEKGLLNWIIGPLWLVAVVMAGPALVDRVRGRGPGQARAQGSEA